MERLISLIYSILSLISFFPLSPLHTFMHAVLIGPNKEPTDPQQASYLTQVKAEIAELEYKKLRNDWLSYQKCSIDVVTFAKRIKLILRGER